MTANPPTASPAGPSVKAAAAYHHGDLRAALIVAAREALETMPPEAITLKSLAARLGVSQPAPYRHFQSREALLAAVAADGFERFRAQLAEAAANAPEGEKFEACCLAYLAFGRANMGVYRLMFASRLVPTSGDGPLGEAAAAAFNFLVEGLAHRVPPERVQAMAVWVWSTLHGLVMLEAEGLLPGRMKDQASSAEVVRQMAEVFASPRGPPSPAPSCEGRGSFTPVPQPRGSAPDDPAHR
jgi:AcrR family transcriptional regulator